MVCNCQKLSVSWQPTYSFLIDNNNYLNLFIENWVDHGVCNAGFIRIFKEKLNLEEKRQHQLSRHILPQIYDKSLNSA